MTELIASILFATIVAATPIALAGLGELVTEKSGMLNLGAEGLMAVGALAAFIGAYSFGSPWLGLVFGIAAGVALSLVLLCLRSDFWRTMLQQASHLPFLALGLRPLLVSLTSLKC